MVRIPGGTFTMGSDVHYPEEAPAHAVQVDSFWLDAFAVTNAQFAGFVAATAHVTVAERPPDAALYPDIDPASLVAGSLVFRRPGNRERGPGDWRSWWCYLAGASWREPEGPGSSWQAKPQAPVVHVAYDDASAYAQWAGKRLPTEAEWEFAARGGLECKVFAWGDELAPADRRMANIWLDAFPDSDVAHGTQAVGSYPANGWGLFDMIGNVWEWTSDDFRPHGAAKPRACGCGAAVPDARTHLKVDARTHLKVLKGGSWLCAPGYCQRYRPAARSPQTVETSACHIGFRCAADRDPPVLLSLRRDHP